MNASGGEGGVPPVRAWHDYCLAGHTVDGERRRITFDLVWPFDSAVDIRRATVIFFGVEGYAFEHDLGKNIVLALSEEPLDAFLQEQAELFRAESRWGWPPFWRGDVPLTLAALSAKGVRCFEVSSSYGLTGWVLATGIDHRDTSADGDRPPG